MWKVKKKEINSFVNILAVFLNLYLDTWQESVDLNKIISMSLG